MSEWRACEIEQRNNEQMSLRCVPCRSCLRLGPAPRKEGETHKEGRRTILDNTDVDVTVFFIFLCPTDCAPFSLSSHWQLNKLTN